VLWIIFLTLGEQKGLIFISSENSFNELSFIDILTTKYDQKFRLDYGLTYY